LLLMVPGFARGQAAATKPAEPVAVEASAFEGLIIGEVRIEGLERIAESYVRNRIRSQAGQPYMQEQVQRDRSALLRTGRFFDVQAEPRQEDGEIVVTFSLEERKEVAGIEFVGNEELERDDLTEVLPFAVGDPLGLFGIRQGREAIERLYQEKGYAYVEVSFNEQRLEDEQVVEYIVIENQRVRVRDIRFEGNSAYADSELKWIISTKEYIPIFRTGQFKPDQAERDAAMVQKYYRDRGYLDAEVGYTLEFKDVARENLSLIFRVNEGARYAMGELHIEGNEVFTDEELLEEMSLEEGDYLIDTRLQKDKKHLKELYGSQGYIYAQVVTSWVFSSTAGEVILTFSINEGEQFAIGDIRVRGNKDTHEKCVRRELRFYPMETFDTEEMSKAEKRLKGTGLFTEANIEPVGDQPGVRDALVTVEENPQTTQFIAGVGASSNSGVIGNIVLENTNFDLFDTPRSFGEFFKGQSFRGAGQTMRISLEPGTELSRFRIDFREPYLMDKPIGFGTSLYLFERGRDGYDEERVGGNFSFDRRFEEGWLEGWIGEIAFRMENVEVNDRDAWAAEDIRDVDGSNFLTTVKLSLLHDTTDSRYEPTEGHRLRFSWEQAAGDFYHAKTTGSYSQHWPVYEDEEGRKSVFTVRGRVGQILGDSPVFERFYAGSIGSMRGFDYRGVSPRDGIRDNRVGGEFMVLGGVEYSFPLYAEAIRGVFFSDMGTVEEDFGLSSWRASVGFGVRLTLQIFGTVPMEFDFAIPVVDEDEDDTRTFNFFIGLPFF